MSEMVSVLECSSCGQLDPGPRGNCTACYGTDLIVRNVESSGQLISWTMIRRPPTAFRDDGPYAVAVVKLDVGVQVTGRLDLMAVEPAPGSRVVALTHQSNVPVFSPGE